MKRIFLLCAAAFALYAADAQTTKTKKSKKATSAETKTARLEKERQQRFEDERLARLTYDSIRHENDRLADAKLDSERIAYKQIQTHLNDSINQVTWKSQSALKEQWTKAQYNREKIVAAANLGPTQTRRVNDIFQTYDDKARMVMADTLATEEQKNTQLVALNAERKDKIVATIGKSKAKKLEKERKDFVQKNGDSNTESAWIDRIDGMVKNK